MLCYGVSTSAQRRTFVANTLQEQVQFAQADRSSPHNDGRGIIEAEDENRLPGFQFTPEYQEQEHAFVKKLSFTVHPRIPTLTAGVSRTIWGAHRR